MPLLAALKKNMSGGAFLTTMVKPSSGDHPPSDDEAEPASQTSTSCASASHPSVSSGDMSGLRVADLGQGTWWICSPHSEALQDTATMHALSDQLMICADLDALSEALASCTQAGGPAEGRSGNVSAFYPEEMERLGKLKWDGDGHYILDTFPGTHPPTLGQIITYLQMVDDEIQASRIVVHLTSQGRRAVSAVLAGAFLVLARGLTAEEAWEKTVQACGQPGNDPQTAWDRFSPPFSETGETGPSSLTVLDCLRGLEVAKEKNWLEDYRLFDVQAWKLMREKFDASWLIPGEILAMANPFGTSQNPRFPGLLGKGPEPDQWLMESQDLSGGIQSFKSAPSLQVPDDSEWPLKQRSCSGGVVSDLLNTPVPDENKGVRNNSWKLPFSRSQEHERLEADTFVSLMRRSKVYEVTRLNYECECRDQKLYEKAFMEHGVRVHHLPFLDGDIPSKAVVNEFLKQCKKAMAKEGTIALHCMGGMGRTGVMAGTHAAAHHHVDGKAFHGWTRICRPGTVQTVKQEVFLRALDPQAVTRVASSGTITGLMGRLRIGS
mmetsp:Transcript_32321/g.72593  ORF Transcript_32321/g.72593 Transcript_32321/m.72593 type:complete len:550 (+) Transcript_32321:44-1693(+)